MIDLRCEVCDTTVAVEEFAWPYGTFCLDCADAIADSVSTDDEKAEAGGRANLGAIAATA